RPGRLRALGDWRSTMLRNTRVQMATSLAVGALLGYLAVSGRLSPLARACAGQLLAPAESSSGAKPACCDEVNKGRLLAEINRVAPGGGAEPEASRAARRRPTPTPNTDGASSNACLICRGQTPPQHHLRDLRSGNVPPPPPQRLQTAGPPVPHATWRHLRQSLHRFGDVHRF